LSRSARSEFQVDPACAEAAQRAARALEQLGHSVEESHPEAMADGEATRAFVAVVACSVARTLDVLGERVGHPPTANEVEPLTWALAELGRHFAAPRYLAAVESVHALGRRMASWWDQGFDLLITPATGQPPPRIGELVPHPERVFEDYARSAPYGMFTSIFNLTGQPAISLPVHRTEGGLPVGAQLVAAYGREDLLIRVAAQLEQALPWRERRAPAAE
ncbi:MAG TPA: amidase family protein, partial [Terriglobales bacterium]|nr:amidase family protein [Terriglobales bacterium]